MAYSTSPVLGVRTAATSTTAEHALGTTVNADNGGKLLYVKAGGTIAANDYVTVDEDFTASAGTKAGVDAGHTIGVAPVAFVANDYGWVYLETRGNVSVNVLASCAADAPLYTSATAGKLDDDSTSQTKIPGIVIVSTNGGSTAAVECIFSPTSNG